MPTFEAEDIKKLQDCAEELQSVTKKLESLSPELVDSVKKLGMDKVTRGAEAVGAATEDVMVPSLKEGVETFLAFIEVVTKIHAVVGTDL